MTKQSYEILPMQASQLVEVDAVTIKIFGPGMFARAAYHLRAGVEPEIDLSFVAKTDERIIGSVRQTRIWIGDHRALLLGPLGVLPVHKNGGIGRDLMAASVEAARAIGDDVDLILLVGDYAYYKPFGFKSVAGDKIDMPRPVDPGRVLACELQEGALKKVQGEARRWR